jgi:hypothetical protein
MTTANLSGLCLFHKTKPEDKPQDKCFAEGDKVGAKAFFCLHIFQRGSHSLRQGRYFTFFPTYPHAIAFICDRLTKSDAAPLSVNVGELLRPGSPSRLYFDLEWYESERNGENDRARLVFFLEKLADAIAQTSNMQGRPRVAITTGSRMKGEGQWKGSYHVVVTNVLVQDNRDTRVAKLICELAGEDPLFFTEQNGQRSPILDKSVYTRNRNFRIPGSLKDSSDGTGLVPFYLDPDAIPAVDLAFSESRVYTRREQLQAMLIKLRDDDSFTYEPSDQVDAKKEKAGEKGKVSSVARPATVKKESAAEARVRVALERWIRMSLKSKELGWKGKVVLSFSGTFGHKVYFYASMNSGEHTCPTGYKHQGNSNHRWQLYYDRKRFAFFSKCFPNGKNNETCAKTEVRLWGKML